MAPLRALRFSGRSNVIWLTRPFRAAIPSSTAGDLLERAMHTTEVGKYCAFFFETGRQSLSDHMCMDPIQQDLRMYSDCGNT